MFITETLDSVRKRATALGRWAPVVFYVLIVVSWFANGVRAGAHSRLWLMALTLLALGLYLWRTGRRP
jgi:uncharacterized membrane protein YobD (UPF0266 family)